MKDLLRRLEEAMWSDDDIRYAFDANPNLTLKDLARKTGKTVKQLKRILREEAEVQSNAPMSETVRAFHKKGLQGKLKTHQDQFWWYRTLDWISDKKGRSGRPIGGGNLEITPKEAGELKKMGYIEIEDRPSLTGKRATLTSKGRKAWRQAQDAFDEI